MKASYAKGCDAGLAEEYGGETILNYGRPMYPLTVSGDHATVVLQGGEDEIRARMVYSDGRWKFEPLGKE